jgi:hypothetical protein
MGTSNGVKKQLEITSIKSIEFGMKSASLWLEVLLTQSVL